jgi:prepilin signal peptidase PulO-like enzyme (type II secretory pathway)
MAKLSWFSLAMSAFYAVMGLLFLTTNVLAEALPHYRAAIGGVLLGYGILRGWMWYRKWRNDPAQQW